MKFFLLFLLTLVYCIPLCAQPLHELKGKFVDQEGHVYLFNNGELEVRRNKTINQGAQHTIHYDISRIKNQEFSLTQTNYKIKYKGLVLLDDPMGEIGEHHNEEWQVKHFENNTLSISNNDKTVLLSPLNNKSVTACQTLAPLNGYVFHLNQLSVSIASVSQSNIVQQWQENTDSAVIKVHDLSLVENQTLAVNQSDYSNIVVYQQVTKSLIAKSETNTCSLPDHHPSVTDWTPLTSTQKNVYFQLADINRTQTAGIKPYTKNEFQNLLEEYCGEQWTSQFHRYGTVNPKIQANQLVFKIIATKRSTGETETKYLTLILSPEC